MRAARWWGPGDIRVDEVEDPADLPTGWVLVRVEACGICGTDIEEYRSGPVVIPTSPAVHAGGAAAANTTFAVNSLRSG